jgi:hypothetical protein
MLASRNQTSDFCRPNIELGERGALRRSNYVKLQHMSRGVGIIKILGDTGFQGHFWILKRAPKGNPKRTPKRALYSIHSDISLYKKGTFHHKKGHFWSFEKTGGGGALAPCAPLVPTPLHMSHSFCQRL